jgi:hypothetical protein
MLLLTATATDITPPTPGVGVFGTATDKTAVLIWTAATDNETPQESLRYFVYQSSSNNLATPADCEANGVLLNSGGSINITDYTASGLMPGSTYFFNVVVADQTNNKAAYLTKELTTTGDGIADNALPAIVIYPNPTTGELRINKGACPIISIGVFDVYGKMQKAESRKQKAESEIVMDISSFASGIYFLRIQTEQGTVTRKFVKN